VRKLVMLLIGQTVNFGKIMAACISDVEDARYSQKAQIVPST
jgi:hypothetical protein